MFIHKQCLDITIVHTQTMFRNNHCPCIYNVMIYPLSIHKQYSDITTVGYIGTLFAYEQWLYQDIVWTVVITEHCLCMDRGNIKTLFMYG
jgi:hypothetical protein